MRVASNTLDTSPRLEDFHGSNNVFFKLLLNMGSENLSGNLQHKTAIVSQSVTYT